MVIIQHVPMILKHVLRYVTYYFVSRVSIFLFQVIDIHHVRSRGHMTLSVGFIIPVENC